MKDGTYKSADNTNTTWLTLGCTPQRSWVVTPLAEWISPAQATGEISLVTSLQTVLTTLAQFNLTTSTIVRCCSMVGAKNWTLIEQLTTCGRYTINHGTRHCMLVDYFNRTSASLTKMPIMKVGTSMQTALIAVLGLKTTFCLKQKFWLKLGTTITAVRTFNFLLTRMQKIGNSAVVIKAAGQLAIATIRRLLQAQDFNGLKNSRFKNKPGWISL